ncbi:MAG: hypothetical protein MUF64_22500 [Polyangiaceae bacterium]|nr:hypothetical protein [Polyangiaceae bacterium]
MSRALSPSSTWIPLAWKAARARSPSCHQSWFPSTAKTPARAFSAPSAWAVFSGGIGVAHRFSVT